MIGIVTDAEKTTLAQINDIEKFCPAIGDRIIIGDISYVALHRTLDLDDRIVYVHVSKMMGGQK